MNHFKSLKIGNSLLLFIGCSIIAFSVTHFYFKDPESPKITAVLGHILLSPFYVFESITLKLGLTDFTHSAYAVFFVLFFSYAFASLFVIKLLGKERIL
jgi:hypothetical protein